MSSGIQASLAGRYATALFELARETKPVQSGEARRGDRDGRIEPCEAARGAGRIGRSAAADRQPAGLARRCDSRSRGDGKRAQARRYDGEVPRRARRESPAEPACAAIRAFRQLAAAHRGETSAEVTSAHPLSDDQVAALKQQLRTRLGRDVAIDLSVDPSLLGGLVVRIGSQMIDSSIKTRLNSLAHAMKG